MRAGGVGAGVGRGAVAASSAAAHGEGRGWSLPMRAMHWATPTLLLGSYAAILAARTAATGAEAAWLAMLHRSFGVTILVLTLVRLAWRQRTRVPPLPGDLPTAQRLAARASVVVLYATLILQPLLGLGGSMLHGDRITVFGGVVLPNVLPTVRPLARLAFQAHGWIALLLPALAAAHASAALHHHFVRRNGVLARMLPGMRRTRPAGTGTGGGLP